MIRWHRLRATTEATMTYQRETLDVVRGSLPGHWQRRRRSIPATAQGPAHLLTPARAGASKWLDRDYSDQLRFCHRRG